MTRKDAKRLLEYYRNDIHDHLKMYTYLRTEYERMQAVYDDQIEHNQKLYFSGQKIDKITTDFILDCFQIITDAFIYKIDPTTGCCYLYK